MAEGISIVVYGATGFAGRLAAQHLSRAGAGHGLAIAIAGRNPDKLAEIAASCDKPPAIIGADSKDSASVEAMVERAQVVLNFAGPFALHGEPVIAACARQGRHYLDITGETPFIRSMIGRYQTAAETSGARLIPFSGFDSVPADLMVAAALEEAKDAGISLDHMTLQYEAAGGFNGGTLASLLNIAEEASIADLLDPNILVLDPEWPKAQRPSLQPRYEPYFKRWTAPFLMAPINQAVVQRSCWLRSQSGEGDDPFLYEERMAMGHKLGAAQSWAVTGALAGVGLLAFSHMGRSVLKGLGPKPGEGPTPQTRAKGFFRGKLLGQHGGKPSVAVHMERPGDPGNDLTALFASEAALLAAKGDFSTEYKGFLTPSVAFGKQLTASLQNQGFVFNVEQLA